MKIKLKIGMSCNETIEIESDEHSSTLEAMYQIKSIIINLELILKDDFEKLCLRKWINNINL